MSRPREFDADAALRQCMDVFWTKGFHATSYEDLTTKTQVKKQSLYGVFKNKRELFLQSLQVYREQNIEFLKTKTALEKSPVRKLEAICEAVLHKEEESGSRGCLIINSTLEFGSVDAEVSREVRLMWDQVEELIEQIVQDGQEQGSLTSRMNSRELAVHLNNVLGGVQVMEKSGASREQIAGVLHTTIELMRT